MEDNFKYVFHFTGKLNQSYIMKTLDETPVYEAICQGIKLFSDTPFTFVDHLSGIKEEKKISHTKTSSIASDLNVAINLYSTFTIDKEDIWQMLNEMGYHLEYSLNGFAVHYDVFRRDKLVGFVELGGTGLMNPKYKDSKLGQIPTNGIWKVQCEERDVANFFVICLALTKVESNYDTSSNN